MVSTHDMPLMKREAEEVSVVVAWDRGWCRSSRCLLGGDVVYVGYIMPSPQIHENSEPQNVTLVGSRVFADVIR